MSEEWIVKPVVGLPDEEFYAVMTVDGKHEICILPRNVAGEVNSRKIAALPKLLSATKLAHEQLSALQRGAMPPRSFRLTIAALAIAIRKAEGG